MAELQQVIDQMQDNGLPPLPQGHPVLDGKIHRYGPKKKAWYALREIDLRSGGRVIGGAFGYWQGDNNNAVQVTFDWKGVSAEERAVAEQKQREFDEREREKRQRLADAAANRARQQWEAALTEGVSPYLERKKVSSEGVRFFVDGTLLVPMVLYRPDGRKIVGLQKIAPDGAKRFNKGMQKTGAACKLGRISQDEKIIGVTEGYATARSVRMASSDGVPIVVAFDAGNLLPVARMLREANPDVHLLFFADDDFRIEARLRERLADDFKVTEPIPIDGSEHLVQSADGQQVIITATWRQDPNGVDYIEADVRSGRIIRTLRFENAGISKAKAAAKAVGNASVIWPTFTSRGGNKWTDFNDLHVEESFEVVTSQVQAALLAALSKPPAGQVLSLVKNSPHPTEKDEPQGPDGDAGAGGREEGAGKGKRVKRSKEFWETVNHLLEHFVLLYGTNTAWDDVNRIQIKITDLRYAYGSDAVKFWLNNGSRKMINADQLVFDPTGKCDPQRSVNLFNGFQVESKVGDCSLIKDLLLHLCDGNEDLFDWIIKWTAYPLRHPGAKMTTSVIMHGDEGSGKNLFWEKVVRRIYGEYGGVIGNAQIESQFNEWASKKLFFVCDEVVTRNELRQLKGKLKQMISGDEININPKNLPERREANHLNFVFLSNELQPLALDKTDRRYLVIWTPPKKDLAYYRAVADQAYSGGMEAFYHYLLHEVDLGDFNEHTKPLDTVAKRKLIALGLEAPERFYREWSSQSLPLPFISCSAMQLYAGFQRWCHLNGERFPPSQTVFGAKVERYAVGAVTRRKIKYALGSVDKQRTVYLVGEVPEGQTLSDYVEAGSALFEQDLKKYRHVYDQPQNE